MKKLQFDPNWPDSWKYSYPYDQQEIYGQISNYGYAYAYANRRRKTIELLQKYAPKGSRLLDIAAAQGNFSLTLAEAGYRVTWNDLREDLADYVRLKYEHGSIEYCPGNAFEIDFQQPFDAVLITEIIEHVAHPDEFLAKCGSLVKPGGHIIMTTPNGEYFRNSLPKFSDCPDPSQFESTQFGPNSDGHIFLIHADELDGFAKNAGLTLVKTDFFTNPLTNGHVKTETLLRVLPKSIVNLAESVSQRIPQRLARPIQVHMAAVFRKN